MKVIKQLRGGSLSSAKVIERETGLFVRKECSLNANREHGLVRLFSQKNKQNYLSQTFPQYFVPILDSGLDRISGTAYIELEYKEGYTNLFEALSSDISSANVAKIFENIRRLVEDLARVQLKSRITAEALNLYFEEELLRPVEMVKAAGIHPVLRNEYFTFEGRKVRSLAFQDLGGLESSYLGTDFGYETLTHGNLTLENILISSDFQDVKLIDCYDENYLSSKYNDLSQLLQCTQAFYSTSVSCEKNIADNSISSQYKVSRGVRLFNEMFEEYLTENLCASERRLVNIYLVSQFTRMLPFKMKGGDISGAVYYFALASSLYECCVLK